PVPVGITCTILLRITDLRNERSHYHARDQTTDTPDTHGSNPFYLPRHSIKPLFRDASVLSTTKDTKEKSSIAFMSVVSFVVKARRPRRDCAIQEEKGPAPRGDRAFSLLQTVNVRSSP